MINAERILNLVKKTLTTEKAYRIIRYEKENGIISELLIKLCDVIAAAITEQGDILLLVREYDEFKIFITTLDNKDYVMYDILMLEDIMPVNPIISTASLYDDMDKALKVINILRDLTELPKYMQFNTPKGLLEELEHLEEEQNEDELY